MNEISSVNVVYRPLSRTATPAVADRPNQPAARPSDYVELSDLGTLLSASLQDSPPLRVARIAEIRSAIQRGDYETEDKLNHVVDRLHELLTDGSGTADPVPDGQ
ncbi:MAG TPA: flagellar biosynthesis anti-sigma factor FlgM [Phycisphaerae bacterium]